MTTEAIRNNAGLSLLALGLGLAAGATAALLTTPMRGAEMRRSLRRRADDALGQCRAMLDESRHALKRADASTQYETPGTGAMTATLGEIAQMHAGDDLSSLRGRS